MKELILGRCQEKITLEKIYASRKSEFVAICGRRRVGKTFLVREFFDESLVFQTAGLANGTLQFQMTNFYKEMLEAGLRDMPHEKPRSWTDIFFLLRSLVSASKQKRKVIFLDELPWMDTPKSNFISALEHFWNTWASARKDIILVVCGSATSWMMNKLINNHGGLHNRLTAQIFLQQFTLNETRQFLENKGFNASLYDISTLYMCMGGVPFYLDMLDSSKSLTQNIDDLFFKKQGGLHNEFKNLYSALFKNSDDYITVVKALNEKRYGMTRDEVIKKTGLKSGKGLSTVLENLESCGFIRSYSIFNGTRGSTLLFQLVDFYSLFYFNFIEHGKTSSWQQVQGKPVFYVWAGLTFENLVMQHVQKIKEKLGISGIDSRNYVWRTAEKGDKGAQIDLIIDRADNTINICEIKFSIAQFAIKESYEMNLRNKIQRFMEENPKKSIQLTFVTTYGLSNSKYNEIVSNQVVAKDLFG